MVAWTILLIIAGISLSYVVFMALISALRASAQRVICPETRRPAEIACDPAVAVRGTFTGEYDRVVQCSRWPGRAGCDQDCVKHVLAPRLNRKRA